MSNSKIFWSRDLLKVLINLKIVSQLDFNIICFLRIIFLKQKNNLVGRVSLSYIFANLFNVWLYRRQLDSPICCFYQSIMICSFDWSKRRESSIQIDRFLKGKIILITFQIIMDSFFETKTNFQVLPYLLNQKLWTWSPSVYFNSFSRWYWHRPKLKLLIYLILTNTTLNFT